MDRKETIINSTLNVILEQGVNGTTHRKIAADAKVPLGSLTYYFSSLDDILCEAFMKLASDISASFTARLSAAQSQEEACEAIIDMILSGDTSSSRTLLLSYELYSYASRKPELKDIMAEWMKRSRRALERHFTPLTAMAMDAFIEGMMTHNAVIPVQRADVARVVSTLASLGGQATQL